MKELVPKFTNLHMVLNDVLVALWRRASSGQAKLHSSNAIDALCGNTAFRQPALCSAFPVFWAAVFNNLLQRYDNRYKYNALLFGL